MNFYFDILEKHFDELSQDPQINSALQDPNYEKTLFNLESIYTEEINKLEKDLIIKCDQNPEIKNIPNQYKSISDILSTLRDDLSDSIGELRCLGQYQSTIGFTKDISEYFTLSTLFGYPSLSHLLEIHKIFLKHPQLNDTLKNKTAYQIFKSNERSIINSKIAYIVDNLSQGKNNTNEKVNEECKEYYAFFKQIIDFSDYRIIKLQEECVARRAKNIINSCFYRGSFKPFFEKEKEIIKQFLSFDTSTLTPEKIPQYEYENVESEFRIIKFIFELPIIIENALNGLRSVLDDELFQFNDFFTQELKKEYVKYLNSISISKNLIKEAMKWCFIFRVIAFQKATVAIKSPFRSCIEEIMNYTIKLSNIKSNFLYDKYTNSSTCPLIIEYNSLISKGHPCEFILPKDTTERDNPAILKKEEDYVNNVIRIFKKEISPIIKDISLYYALLFRYKNKSEKTWLDYIINLITLYKNKWFIDYALFAGQVMKDDLISVLKFDERLIINFIGYLNLYVSCHEGFYLSSVDYYFNQYFNKNIKNNEALQDKKTKAFINKDDSIDDKFINDNYQNFIVEVKKIIDSKLRLFNQFDSKKISLSKIQNEIRSIKDKDNKMAQIGLVYLFALKFSDSYYMNVVQPNDSKGIHNIPSFQKMLLDNVMHINMEKKSLYTLITENFYVPQRSLAALQSLLNDQQS